MVVGNGMIATRFSNYIEDDRFVIFASGVSNSTLNDSDSFDREMNLLKKTIQNLPKAQLVYFSTCSIYDPAMKASAYVLHKLAVEKTIQETHPDHIIFRVSNPIGKTGNKHTILNYFIDHITNHEPFVVWKYATRNLIDLDDMYAICNLILQEQVFKNPVINIANPVNYSVLSIVHTIEHYFQTKAVYSITDRGSSPLIDTTAIEKILSTLKIEFDDNYLVQLLQKYFPVHEL
jgi:nucleoside-diphosphate-sugar epimerase